ncbi:MAG: PKD domain-containing protein, partial [Candidatus Omnitrophota bacterium]
MHIKKNRKKIFWLILVFFWAGRLVYAQGNDLAGDALYEYGKDLYQSGRTTDAIHELNKCLLKSPNNEKCRAYLEQISGGAGECGECKSCKELPKSKPCQEVKLPEKPSPRKEYKEKVKPRECGECKSCKKPQKEPRVCPRTPPQIKGPPRIDFNSGIKACANQKTLFYAKVIPEDAADNLYYRWDFGDGTSAEGRRVEKIYSQPGVYLVRLTACDLSTGKAIRAKQNRIRVYVPPQANAGEDQVICLGCSVTLDGSQSKNKPVFELCSSCNLFTYTWDFGDGTPEAQGIKVNHRYEKPGNYQATLTVYDKKSKKCAPVKDSVSVLVNTNPYPVIREVKNTCVGKSIDFACFFNESEGAYSKRSNLKYTWDFGDGTVVEGGSSTTHAYQKGGEYLVKVTADDQLGTVCSVGTQTIKVKVNAPPIANTGPDLVCCDNIESVFDGSSSSDPDGDRLTYTWDFGDGHTANGARVTHNYK